MRSRKLLIVIAALVLCTSTLAGQSHPKRKHINLPNRPPNAPFSDAVMVGDSLYLAGRIGLDAKTGKLPTDVDVEIRNLLGSFQALLAQVGMSMDDLVTVQVFCPDVSLYERFNAAYRHEFKKDLPARAFIGSGPLLFGAHFEMQGIAVRNAVEAQKKTNRKNRQP
ncbi:MAG TPA: RidA family protein [Clostridia bacterium]|nr:RidA family protein [Clostridia bacterium]